MENNDTQDDCLAREISTSNITKCLFETHHITYLEDSSTNERAETSTQISNLQTKRCRMTRKKKFRNRNIYVYSFLAVMVAVIVSSAVYQNQTPILKLAAKDYFGISDAVIVEADMDKSTDNQLFINQIRFSLTAVGGDAHNVLVKVGGMSAIEDWPQISLLNQNETVSILTPELVYPYRSIKTADGYFPFTVKIDSIEASGTITIMIKE
jgi:hypothetical protein